MTSAGNGSWSYWGSAVMLSFQRLLGREFLSNDSESIGKGGNVAAGERD